MSWWNRCSIRVWYWVIISLVVTAPIAGCSQQRPVNKPDDKIQNEVTASVTSSVAVNRLEHPSVRPTDYVGSEACKICHAEIARQYQSHPMSKSLASVTSASPLEDYDDNNTFETPAGVRYKVERRDGHVFHHERLMDADDQAIYDDSVEIQFALGSGTRGRSYLIGAADVLTISPIGWYTAQGWDLSPGYKPGKHQRFNRRVTDGCLQCHSGRPNFDRTASNRFPSPTFHEAAIGCERCHGPGAQHIAFRQRLERLPTDVDPIVNPKQLAFEEREAVCNQCHLQSEERIPRYGRSEFDFRPGDKITDIWTVYMRQEQIRSDGSIAAVTQVQQMRSSQCYKASEGRMGCTSCHDPHRTPDVQDRDSYYRAKCLACHSDQSCAESPATRTKLRADDSCIACHMTPLTAEIVPHTSQTDHRVSRKFTVPNRTTVSALQLITFDDGGKMPQAEQSRSRGLLLIRQAEPRQHAQLANEAEEALTNCLEQITDDPDVFEALGVSCLIQHRPQDAAAWWLKALKLQSHRESTHWRLGVLYHDKGDFVSARAHLEEVVRLNPGLAQAYGRLAHVYGQMGQLELGIEFGEKALKLDPTLQPIYKWLAEAYGGQGKESMRLRTLEQAERLREALQRIGANR